MANINNDPNFDTQNLVIEPSYDLDIGQIIYLDENQNCENEGRLEVPSENIKKINKPTKTRSSIYQFFEWDNDTNKWKCTTCK